MDKDNLEHYSDYLISAFGYAPATGLSKLLNEQICHDGIKRLCREKNKYQKMRSEKESVGCSE